MQHKFTLLAFLTLLAGFLSACSGGGSDLCTDVQNPTVSCNAPIGQNDTLRLEIFRVEPGNTYRWTGSDGFTSTEQNPVIIHPAKGKNKWYKVQIKTAGGCEYTDSVTGINIVGPWAPCGLDSNTAQLEKVTYMSLRSIQGSVTGSSTYQITGTSTNSGVVVEFAGLQPPVEGVYTIQASAGTLATGYARVTITTTTTGAWTPTSGSVYVSVDGGAVTVSFCNLTFTSTNGSSIGRINMTMP
jgi:hypothetical protein